MCIPKIQSDLFYEGGAAQEISHQPSQLPQPSQQPPSQPSQQPPSQSSQQPPSQSSQQPPPVAEVKVEADVGQQQQYQPVNYKVVLPFLSY